MTSHISSPKKPFTMAESKKNDVTLGMSGKFGEMFVFRQKDGKTIASRAPGPRTGEPTADQQAVRGKFQLAVIYGKTVMANELLKHDYKSRAEPGQTAYNVAIADYFQAPDIVEVDLSQYTGQIGQQIRIRVTDDFEVTSVAVTIHNQDGTLQEEGDAAMTPNKLDWIYTANSTNASLSGDKITIMATDTPANMTKKEQVLP
jgi:hypothetical protein